MPRYYSRVSMYHLYYIEKIYMFLFICDIVPWPYDVWVWDRV
jgi:hypothetical protein